MLEVVGVMIVEVAPLLRRRHCSKPVNLLISLSIHSGLCFSLGASVQVLMDSVIRPSCAVFVIAPVVVMIGRMLACACVGVSWAFHSGCGLPNGVAGRVDCCRLGSVQQFVLCLVCDSVADTVVLVNHLCCEWEVCVAGRVEIALSSTSPSATCE